MAIEDDLRAAIDKNLSAEIGTSLKTRLQIAEDDAKRAELLTKKMNELNRKLEILEDERREKATIDEKLEELTVREKAVGNLEFRKEALLLQQKHCEERVKDMKEIVLAVFANNHFKYQVSDGGSVPFAGPPGSYPQSGTFSRTVTAEGTGAPPPPPTSPVGHGG